MVSSPPVHFHLIGVAGTAMAALARLLTELDHRVTGSDENVYPPMSTELDHLGVEIKTPYAAASLEPWPDQVVVGNAIPRGNPELEHCLDNSLRYTSQAEVIEDYVLPGRSPVVVSGTHGKTTTTSLIAWVLEVAGREPGWFVGGVAHDLPATARLGSGTEFVIEGDEYDTAYFDKRPKFHHYRPRILVIGNLEHDHADIYPDLESISLEFRRLVNTVPSNGMIAVGAESKNAVDVTTRARCPVVTYGVGRDHEIRAEDVESGPSGVRFRLHVGSEDRGVISLLLPGLHNIRNALAAIAVAEHLQLPPDVVAKALATFRGVRRRLELLTRVDDIELYDDFAHHPTAIMETLRALRLRRPGGRLWAVLEPRSWSMRRNLHQATLATALSAADIVVVAPVFEPERVPDGRVLDIEAVAGELRSAGSEVHLPDDIDSIIATITRGVRSGDTVVLMSNGGFGGIQAKLADALQSTAE